MKSKNYRKEFKMYTILDTLPSSYGDYCKYCDTPFTTEQRFTIDLDSGTWFICEECHYLRLEFAE